MLLNGFVSSDALRAESPGHREPNARLCAGASAGREHGLKE
jgi:hypothetical protein